jgi:hypothetical protein
MVVVVVVVLQLPELHLMAEVLNMEQAAAAAEPCLIPEQLVHFGLAAPVELVLV